jgi:N-methylhydantoinase A
LFRFFVANLRAKHETPGDRRARMADLGVTTGLYIMQSNGGIYAAEIARKKPVHIVESGPAAGVILAAHVAPLTGCRNVISLDIGGTTAKAGLIQNGAPRISNEFEVGAQAASRRWSAKATGYPLKSGVVDIVEIGAGEEVAWVDSGGALRVGPQSAGAEPVPACYGWGGLLPTLTDAYLVLGRINPVFFLGGTMRLARGRRRSGRDSAREQAPPDRHRSGDPHAGGCQCQNDRGTTFRFGRAWPRSARIRARGSRGSRPAPCQCDRSGTVDPRGHHSPEPGRELGTGPVAGRYPTRLRANLHQGPRLVDLDLVNRALAEFAREGRALLEREGIGAENQRILRTLEMRLQGQSFELNVALDPGTIGDSQLQGAAAAFHDLHALTYSVASAEQARTGDRMVWFQAGAGSVSTPIYDRHALPAGARVPGPAILEQFDSTVLIQPGYEGTVDAFGSVHLVAAVSQAMGPSAGHGAVPVGDCRPFSRKPNSVIDT